MAYRRLGKSPGLPYTWETQSESVMKDESHGSHSLDHQADPLRSDMSPAREPKPSTRSRLRHHRSTIMTGVQGAFSASASTVSLTATRLRNLGKGSHEPTSTEPTTHGVIAKRSYRDLARSTFFKSSVDVTKVENATTASENPTDVAEDNTVYSMTDFQGGSSWTSINPGCKYLELDLFHPHDPQSPEDSLDDGILQPRELAPLSCFRNLRSLKITGMLLSYQREIWQAVWLNPGLEDLELDMAIGPVLVSPAPSGWRWIEGDWKPTVSSDIGNTYYGETGEGNLHPEIGEGEYLDKLAIMDGRDAARDAGSRLRRLSIVNLKLSGFVIDAGPLSTFFDVHRLKTVEFGCGCIDAGILLPIPMKGITIITPRFHSGNISTIPVVRPPQAGVVELEDGRVVARWPIWKVSGAFAQIRGHLAMRAEKKAKEETETKGKKAKKEKDAKGKGKAVDQGEVQTMLDQLLPYRLKPQTPPTPSPPRRRRGLGFFSLRSRSHSNFDDANNYRD